MTGGCGKRFWTWNVAGILQQLKTTVSKKHQSATMQYYKSVHYLCSGALALVMQGQEVFAQQMDQGRLQVTSMFVVSTQNPLACCNFTAANQEMA